jgi:hypothetical protein
MEHSSKMKKLLERMVSIERMERGKLCRMTGRSQYNHQTWRNGRNEVRYVPESEAAALREAIEGYQRFMKLAEAYVDEVIERTRRTRKQGNTGGGKARPENKRASRSAKKKENPTV